MVGGGALGPIVIKTEGEEVMVIYIYHLHTSNFTPMRKCYHNVVVGLVCPCDPVGYVVRINSSW